MLAGRLLGRPAAAVETGTSPRGAPLAGPLAVSITHTAGLVVAAASDRADRIGIDVERLGRTTRPLAIARRHFTFAEAAALGALPAADRKKPFLRLWTLKEAWGKAAGVAVPAALPRIGFRAAGLVAPGRVVSPVPDALATPPWLRERAPSTWEFWVLRVGEHTIAAAILGAGRPSPPPNVLTWGGTQTSKALPGDAVSHPRLLRT